jgi:hypothetical protein
MTEFEYLWGRRCEIQLRACSARIYYQERQRIFELREGIVKAAALVAGSVAFANVTDKTIVQYCAAVVGITSASSLVFGFGNKARDSAKRSAEWTLLARDIEAVGERHFNEVHLNQWAARAVEIEVGAPALHRGLVERCYLRACKELGSTPCTSLVCIEPRRFLCA